MIDACMRNEIDLVLTKSISRFSRNTLDALQLVVQVVVDMAMAVVAQRM